MRYRRLWIVALPVLLLLGAARPSWAWRGGWRWRGGWGWPALGLYLGAGPYWGYPYPYYDPYYPADPYVYAPYARYVQPAETRSSDNSKYDLKVIRAQIDRLRAQVDHDYDDGDISEAQRDTRLHELDQLLKQAGEEATSNGGYLTGEQESDLLAQLHGRSPRSYPATERSRSEESSTSPSVSHRDLTAVTDLHLELRTLLDQKLKEGNITQAQHTAEARYLDQIDQQAHSEAAANGGTLTGDQENAFVQQLHQAYYAINHNLILHD